MLHPGDMGARLQLRPALPRRQQDALREQQPGRPRLTGAPAQVLAATQTPTDKEWFQGTADAVRQYSWLFEDIKNRPVQDLVILSGDHLCAALALCPAAGPPRVRRQAGACPGGTSSSTPRPGCRAEAPPGKPSSHGEPARAAAGAEPGGPAGTAWTT